MGGGSLLYVTLIASVASGQPRPTQPEDRLLDPARLRAELLQRGMSELLQAFLEECPPTGPVEKLIYEREIQLAVYADKSRDEEECLVALDKAISLLEEAIAKYPDDKRSLDWRLQLGKDLIYKRAEPYYNNILFRGGSTTDREQLLAIATRATQAFDDLNKAITRWNQSLQRLNEAELRKVENSGEIARYRALELNSKYFTNWAKFYRALASPPDKTREDLLKDVVTYLTVEKKDWIETDHKESGVQCQSLLLLGMAYRLAGNADKAVEYLRKAVDRVSSLTDPSDKRSLQWVVFLGKMEQIKVLRDTGRFQEAHEAIAALTKGMAEESSSPSLELAAALLEGSIYQKQAETAEKNKDEKAAAELAARSRQPLIALANRRPQAKAKIYAELYSLLGKVADPKKLGPFDMAIYIAGQLGEATRLQQRIDQLRKATNDKPNAEQRQQLTRLDAERNGCFDRAIDVAGVLLADRSELAAGLRPEALFNLAVCYFQRGSALKAIETFTQLVREHPRFERSRDAALYAVQIASDLNRDSANRRAELRGVFIDAMRSLITTYPDTQDARYWRFFLANMLELQGDYRQAADEFAKVDPSHEKYLDARYHRLNSLVSLFESTTASQSADPATVRRQAELLVTEASACAELIAKSLDQVNDAAGRGELAQNAGDALLTAARLCNDPPLSNYEQTLKLLDGFESHFGPYRDLVGRAMRLRIVALQGLNRLDQAKKLIPDYLQRDPENAGATLGALLTSMQQEVQRSRERNDAARADKAATEAVDLARWLYQWAQDSRDRLKPDDLFGIRLQCAQANLEAGLYEEARKLFQQCYDEDAARSPNKEPSHGPTIMGLAESCYRLGQQAAKAGQYDHARKDLGIASQHFLSVWRRAERNTVMWWQALLRALEVPVELREVMITQLEQTRKTRDLTQPEKDQLMDVTRMLARIDQTIKAERTGDAKLGGLGQSFAALQHRGGELRRRIERLMR